MWLQGGTAWLLECCGGFWKSRDFLKVLCEMFGGKKGSVTFVKSIHGVTTELILGGFTNLTHRKWIFLNSTPPSAASLDLDLSDFPVLSFSVAFPKSPPSFFRLRKSPHVVTTTTSHPSAWHKISHSIAKMASRPAHINIDQPIFDPHVPRKKKIEEETYGVKHPCAWCPF